MSRQPLDAEQSLIDQFIEAIHAGDSAALTHAGELLTKGCL